MSRLSAKKILSAALGIQTKPESQEQLLGRLREQFYWSFKYLPDLVRVPALPPVRPDEVVRPLLEASVDDIAFGIQGLEAESMEISRRLGAMRELHDRARKAGARGPATIGDIVSLLVADGGTK